MATRVYFDNCCLARPYDQQTHDRIRLEAHAVLLLLERVRRRELVWIGSAVLVDEIERNGDETVREKVLGFLDLVTEMIDLDAEDRARAKVLCGLGFKTMDAIHLAAAESAGCSAMLTTDDRLASRALRCSARLRVRVVNPIDFARGIFNEDTKPDHK